MGVVVTQENIDLSAKGSGRVERVHVQVGDRFERGAVLAEIDARSTRKEAKMAAASKRRAAAQLRATRAELRHARDHLDRLVRLRDLASGEEVAAARFRAQALEASVQAARARVEEEQARRGQLSEFVEDAALRAPFSGRVALRYLDPGAVVSTGSPILRIITEGRHTIRFAVPERDAQQMRVGQPVHVELSGRNAPLGGTVQAVAPEVDPASGMVFAEAHLEDMAAPPSAGAVARVRVETP